MKKRKIICSRLFQKISTELDNRGETGNMMAYVCMHAQPCLTLCGPMDCKLLGSSVHGIFQMRRLEQTAIPYSRVSSRPKVWTVSPASPALAGRFFYHCATWEAHVLVYRTAIRQKGIVCSVFGCLSELKHTAYTVLIVLLLSLSVFLAWTS